MECHHCYTALQAVPHLKAFTVGQELAHMLCVTMTELGTPQSVAIVVQCHGAIHHFVFSVTVEVSHGEGVVALSTIGAVELAILVLVASASHCTVETPTLAELAVAIVPCLDDGTCIDSTSEDEGRQSIDSVEMCNSYTERASTLPIVIAPRITGVA